ncbi:group II intron reverse transcriptase/maturase [Brevibacillus halotolerans]|uniref:group II intron reverse transcriptase/maturase n=1 Tax=Brevibacillus TaxID=55080 RepID=UPI00215CFF77|nr:group II intron reverse transcriptase/maturase [Brevibacillus laterosporus]MCR8964218.1 group II intron reverse transcriptase/maturase [Brevibacillus laterosporus]MCZ0836373.1 group II intron reverse transcriptase/maturase [Brevibacillus halotolerans]
MSTKLRNNEYYNMQETFDMLYESSRCNNTKGINLLDIITRKNNILLAYRNIKTNNGSMTAGTDGETIMKFKEMNDDEFVELIRKSIFDYTPQPIRRVEIPKPNGTKRPLGIPTIRDRIIQQCFKQVLEPICEAKFHNHSYGFRPNRSANHAIARCQSLINIAKLHYIVDIDIEGFFDNVNHRKLIKQLHNIGVKDKRVLTIVNKMLKAPVKGIGITNKGTPQGGILSPLLSNVVLNDLDWWISSQWETFETRHTYSEIGKKYRALKESSNMKEMFIVRYADDFKIFTREYETAKKAYHGVKKYLNDNLKLNCAKGKSKITNIRKKGSDFLGFKIKARKTRGKYVADTNVSDKAKEKINKNLKELIKTIGKTNNVRNVIRYNLYVLGIQNYYRCATQVTIDFCKISYHVKSTLFNRLKSIAQKVKPKNPSELYKSLYTRRNLTYKVSGTYLFPIDDIRTKTVMNFTQSICDYTEEGRKSIYKNLEQSVTHNLMKMAREMNNQNTEYVDNKMSRYSMQKGKCSVLGIFLTAEDLHCHHIKPKVLGGTDEFKNLTIVHKGIHVLIHATQTETIEKYLNSFNLTRKQLDKLNKFRRESNLVEIIS